MNNLPNPIDNTLEYSILRLGLEENYLDFNIKEGKLEVTGDMPLGDSAKVFLEFLKSINVEAFINGY